MDKPSPQEDNQAVKKLFFDHLRRQGFTTAHLEVYDEYFEFLIAGLGDGSIMNLSPEKLYHRALALIEELEGEDVIEAYLQLLEHFIGFWAERYEVLHPEGDNDEEEERSEESRRRAVRRQPERQLRDSSASPQNDNDVPAASE